MNPTWKTAAKFWMAISLMLVLAACNTAAPTITVLPTTDLGALRTEVAATVLAQCAAQCALTPTITPIPTNTATATATLSPTPTGGTETAPVGTGVAGNRLKWISQTVADGTRMAPGSTFNMTWRVQNAGTVSWTPNYRLRFFSGDRFGAPAEVLLGQEVAPGELVDITIPMKAPATPGEYSTNWIMSTEVRGNFNEPIFLKIVVVAPGTAASTLVAPTQAATTAAATVAPTTAETPAVTVTP